MTTSNIYEIPGQVMQVSETGFTLSGAEGWINKSQYDDVPFPPRNEMVNVTVQRAKNGKLYLKAWEQYVPPYEPTGAAGPDMIPASILPGLPAKPEPGFLRDDKPVVTRLACLNSAIEFCKMNGITEDEIGLLGIAERFVTWATWGGHANEGA